MQSEEIARKSDVPRINIRWLCAVDLRWRQIFFDILMEVRPNNDQTDGVFEVVSVINCRLPVMTDTGRASGPE
jgi:hypothetical protein